MTTPADICVTADWILPVDRPPIRHGMITIADGRIASLHSIDDPTQFREDRGDTQCKQCVRYGNVAILPGLINAHTHLDLSGWSHTFAGRPKLWEWIPEVVRFRRSESYHPGQAIEDGLRAALAGGAVATVDVIPPDWLTWDWPHEKREGWTDDRAWLPKSGLTRLRVFSFIECLAPTGVMRIPPSELFDRHRKACLRLGWHPAISPHAPYTVPLEILEEVVKLAEDRDLILAMHLAETAEEVLFLATGEGPFREMLEKLSAHKPGVFRPGRTLKDVLKVLCRAPRVLIIHGNYLTEPEISLLSRFADRVAVVYCPRSHEFFGHAHYPLEQFLTASIPVLVGTDSRASHPDLSIFGELQAARRRHPELKAETIIRMGTTDAARFLDCDGDLGRLAVGRPATFSVIELPSRYESDDPYEAVLSSQSHVRAVWIDGDVVYEHRGA